MHARCSRWLTHLLSEQTCKMQMCSVLEVISAQDPFLHVISCSILPFYLSSEFSNKGKESKRSLKIATTRRPKSFLSFLLAGMATEVWLPSPHRTGNVCPALGPHHALSHCCHAARLRSQCHRDTGWENQGVSIHTCLHLLKPRCTCAPIRPLMSH